MNTPTDAALFRGESAAELLPLDIVELSEINPRRRIDKVKLQELADNIATHGVLMPILVRRRPKDLSKFEVVAGERRVRAARIAKQERIPAVVRDISDEQALVIACIENHQREDVHPLEEGEGYEKLIKHHGYTVDELVAKVGKSRSYIYQRLKYCDLTETGRKWFYDGALTPATAVVIARIPVPSLQDKALELLAKRWRDTTPTLREVSDLVHEEFMLQLDGKQFKPSDATLVPAVGACGPCPKRTGNAPDLFGDVKDKDTCTDPTCFKGKVDAHNKRLRADAEAKGHTVISGKQAQKLLPYAYTHELAGNEYLRLDTKNMHDPKKRTLQAALGKDVPVAMLQNPHKPSELIPIAKREDITAAAKVKGVPIAPARPTANDSRDRQQQQRDTALEEQIDQQILFTLRGKWPHALQLDDWRFIAGEFLSATWVPELHKEYGITNERNLTMLDAAQCSRLLFDIALLHLFDNGETERLLPVAERHGVDHQAIRQQLTDAARVRAEGEKKDAPTKAKKAKKAKGSKTTESEPPQADGEEATA